VRVFRFCCGEAYRGVVVGRLYVGLRRRPWWWARGVRVLNGANVLHVWLGPLYIQW
jgi:hypothetical protein